MNTFAFFKVKWEDAYGGHGEHFYDINHGDAGYAAAPAPYSPPAPAYSPPAPAYSPPAPAYSPPSYV